MYCYIMEAVTNASMTMADENIRRIDTYFTRMCDNYRIVRDLDVRAIKPLVDDAFLVWSLIFNKVKIIDKELYEKTEILLNECEKISREEISRYSGN